MSAYMTLMGHIAGPSARGDIPQLPYETERAARVEAVVRRVDELEHDVFTRRIREVWLGRGDSS